MEDWVEQPGGVDSYFPTRTLRTAQSFGPLSFIVLSKTTTWGAVTKSLFFDATELLNPEGSAPHTSHPVFFVGLFCFPVVATACCSAGFFSAPGTYLECLSSQESLPSGPIVGGPQTMSRVLLSLFSNPSVGSLIWPTEWVQPGFRGKKRMSKDSPWKKKKKEENLI